MSEFRNRGFQAALNCQDHRSNRLKQRFDLRSQLLSNRETNIFGLAQLTPAYAVVNIMSQARARYGREFYNEAWQIASMAYTNGVETTSRLRTMALASSEVTERTKGKLFPEMQRYFVLLCLVVLLGIIMGVSGCTPLAGATYETDTPTPDEPTVIAPTEATPQDALIGEGDGPAATLTPVTEPTEDPTVTPELTATEEPIDPQQQLEDAAEEAGIPIEAATQFGNIEQDSTGLWHINGNIDESSLQFNTNIEAGNINIDGTVVFRYVNAKGKADWFYIPAISFNHSEGTTVIAANMVNRDGAMLASDVNANSSDVKNFICQYFDGLGSIVSIAFGFPGAGRDMLTQDFFDSAISDLYTSEMIEEFMRTGDSSLLPNRLLIPVEMGGNSELTALLGQ